jgi:hypothetical protein
MPGAQAFSEISLDKRGPGAQLSMLTLELQTTNPEKPEITNYKHHLILKLGQINYNIQISNKIKRQLFGILDLGHCDLFGICDLLFEIFNC